MYFVRAIAAGSKRSLFSPGENPTIANSLDKLFRTPYDGLLRVSAVFITMNHETMPG